MKCFSFSSALVAGTTILSTASAKSGPTSVAYVEVNDNPITSVGQYTLADGSNTFDIAIIFAANINYNGTAAVLYNNEQVQTLLNDAENQIRPLQAQGIKVLLSILGNHQGAGISNFASQADAADFAGQVRDELNQYGLDGVDLDDEYADYGTNGTPQTNDQSIGWLISALRADLPDKLITFYNYGPASDYLSSSSPSIGAQLDYAWNADYDSFEVPDVPGLSNSALSPAAVDFENTPSSDAQSFAQQTVSGGYGAYMTYDLASGDDSAYISAFTQALYGQATTYNANAD
ncbi:MAG: hypothetical protein M1821_001672 [Bathelium mastoideum]|nr:MAG: hypothetical protein M1821_001672 [Bathelium mastoideum]KAI9691561.1 MAG: hypothetical protein M1822_007632 [Bathelium mastoideum]